MEYLLLVLDKDKFEVFREVGASDRYMKEFTGKFEAKESGWLLELHRVEYCALITRIEEIAPLRGRGLLEVMLNYGKAQDMDFEYYLNALKRDLARL